MWVSMIGIGGALDCASGRAAAAIAAAPARKVRRLIPSHAWRRDIACDVGFMAGAVYSLITEPGTKALPLSVKAQGFFDDSWKLTLVR
jgi:hypothetical protein